MKRSRFYYSVPEVETRVAITEDGFVYPITNKVTPRPRLTLCGIFDSEKNVLSFGAAVCSATDRFEKKIGRELSEKRALETPVLEIDLNGAEQPLPDVFISAALELQEAIMSMKNLRLKTKL